MLCSDRVFGAVLGLILVVNMLLHLLKSAIGVVVDVWPVSDEIASLTVTKLENTGEIIGVQGYV